MNNIIVILLLLSSFVFAKENIIIKYPLTSDKQNRDFFQLQLLQFILDKVNVNYEFKPTKHIYTQSRVISELKKGEKINIYWMGSSVQLEKELRPIRFPIYRGLLGHRVFIINKDDQKLFSLINTLEDLQKFKGAQGIGWSDTAILEGSGLEQHIAKYESIFKMINQGGRVSYFSRGLNEAFNEVEVRKNELSNLSVEKNLVLIYPFSMFLFVNKNDEKLATLLEEGFKKAYEDGSFEKFFYSHPKIKESLVKSNLQNRVKIEIVNPFLTPETMAIKELYWHEK